MKLKIRVLTVAELRTAVAKMNSAGIGLLSACVETEQSSRSVMISPFSIDSAFALLWLGASAPIRAEISEALGMPAEMEPLSAVNARLSGTRVPRILTSNSLWVDLHFPLADAYSNLVGRYFPRDVFSFDNEKPEEAAQRMNAFVAEKTEKLITNLISPESIRPRDTGLVLINSLYFKGAWIEPFEESRTRKNYRFNRLDGTETLVPMMQDRRMVRYGETDDCQVLVLPYRFSMEQGADCDRPAAAVRCSFVAILPTPALEVTALLARLGAEGEFAKLLSSCSHGEVEVKLPKFELEYHTSLVEVLKARGLTSIFEEDISSFPAITEGVNGVYVKNVSEVVHATKLKLDESGTEAAAATAIICAKGCFRPKSPIPQFTADHPFLGFIVEEETGCILFAGVISQIGTSERKSRLSRDDLENREAERRANYAARTAEYRRYLEGDTKPSTPNGDTEF